MIGSLRGKIIAKTEKFVLVETGGVGYLVSVSPDTLSRAPKTNEEIFLFIHTHVREDALDLYGFAERDELEFFEMLLGVPGVGPRGALAILGITSVETLRRAIGTGDTSYLTKISGIGKKTAEKIVVELRDKMAKGLEACQGGETMQGELDALEALKSLGYSQSEAREALKKVTPDANLNAKIKEALKILGGR